MWYSPSLSKHFSFDFFNWKYNLVAAEEHLEIIFKNEIWNFVWHLLKTISHVQPQSNIRNENTFYKWSIEKWSISQKENYFP